MTHACGRCSRVNPPEALYCYFDGVALDSHHQGGPVAAGRKLFPTPFVFPDGSSSRNFDELVRACDDDWDAASELLKEGFFQGFLGGLGRADLAMAARQAAKEPDRDRGLDQFLAKLPASGRGGAKVAVLPLEINLGQVTGERRFVIHVENQGDGLLHGSIGGDGVNWLAFGDAPATPRKLFQCRHEQEVAVQIVGQNLRAGNKPIEGRILVETNGGTGYVTVRVEKPVQAFPDGVLAGAKTPREVAAKAKANPKEAAVLFEKGAVKTWYETNGWTYPVQGPSSSGLGAIQQFFEALGLVQPPQVTISQQKIQFQGKPGGFLEQTIQVQTVEKRPVYAHATTTSPWLQIGRPTLAGRIASIPIRVPSIPAVPGERLKGAVQVTSNGNQRFTVEVELAVAGSGSGSKQTAPMIDLSAALAGAPVMAVSSSAPLALEGGRSFMSSRPTPPEHSSEAMIETLEVVTPAILDALPVATPVLEVEPVTPPQRRKAPHLVHLLPVALLMFLLFVPCARDGVFWFWHRVVTPKPPDLTNTPLAMNPEVSRLQLLFHDADEPVTLGTGGIKPGQGGERSTQAAVWEPSMRFGILMIADEKGNPVSPPKRLTFKERGFTNNTVVRLDGDDLLYGESPFRLPNGETRSNWRGKWAGSWRGPRSGRQSTWYYAEQKIAVRQIVEIVPGSQSGAPDTCLIRYVLTNEDSRPHRVGLRFLLDAFIGGNDGVPFLIPGQDQLCTTSMAFNNPSTMPDFIQAREFEDLTKSGTIAQVQLKVGGDIEVPSRVTLGAWPNVQLAAQDPRCQQEKTGWEVPVLPINTLKDSAVALYWNERDLQPGEKREVGFAYGLGNVSSGEGQGKLAVTVGGSFLPEGEFTVTAYVSNPVASQTVTLTLPDNFTILDGDATRSVPRAGGATSVSPVTWKVKGPRSPGTYPLKVKSSTGAEQGQDVRIQAKGIFGSN